MRPAVDAENQRILAIFAPADWFDQPALNSRAVETRKVDLVWLNEVMRPGKTKVVRSYETRITAKSRVEPNLTG